MSRFLKISLLFLFVAGVGLFYVFGGPRYFSLSFAKEQLSFFRAALNERPLEIAGAYFVIYVASVALSLPGATILTLLAGALFGVVWGVVLVSLASTLGATLAFLLARFLLRDWLSKKFPKPMKTVDSGIRREGAFYLFGLRLAPVFPFFLVNLAMGLTAIKVRTFTLISWLAMLPGTVVYVNAGTALSEIQSFDGILSRRMILSFSLLAVLPIAARAAVVWLRRPRKFDYNLIVIGGGSAGLVTSYVASAAKARVALVEAHKMGGDCLNTGCVPSKALIRSSRVMSEILNAKSYGIEVGEVKADFATVMERVQAVIESVAPHDSVERYQGLGVECLAGRAEIIDPHRIRIDGARILSSRNIVIATGAGPRVPNIPGLSEANVYTSDNIWSLRECPKRLLVIGGGAIGCELGQAFSRLGAKVSLVEQGERLLSREEPEVSRVVIERFAAEGIDVWLGAKVLRFEKDNVVIDCQGQEKLLECDAILLALGRRPNTDGLGLEKLGVELRPDGTIVTDQFMRTSVPQILACGDVTGPYQLTHAAAHQAWFAAVNALFAPWWKFKINYSSLPRATFIEPEVASVGPSSLELRGQNVKFEETVFPLHELDRAITDGQREGFVKVLTQSGSDKILAATVVGQHAGESIAELVTAIRWGLGLNKILSTIHSYPTMAEANKYAAGSWRRAHLPDQLLGLASRYHRWRRG